MLPDTKYYVVCLGHRYSGHAKHGTYAAKFKAVETELGKQAVWVNEMGLPDGFLSTQINCGCFPSIAKNLFASIFQDSPRLADYTGDIHNQKLAAPHISIFRKRTGWHC